jgi:hypothetical protein
MRLNKLALAGSLIAALLVGPLSAPVSAAVIKPGASCAKIGVTKTLKGKTYKCIKAGKKKVWDKGKAVAALQPLTFDNLDTKRVRNAAYAEIVKGVRASEFFMPKINFVLGPSLLKSRVDKEIAALKRASSFWSDLYKPEKVYVAYYTDRDGDWVDGALCSEAGYCPTGMNVVISNLIKPGWNCTSAIATKNREGYPFFSQCLGAGSDSVKNRATGPHEYTHFLQQAYADWISIPNWWTEGSADYFGNTLGVFNAKKLPSEVTAMSWENSYNWLRQDLCPLNEPTVELIANCFKFTETPMVTPPGQGNRWLLAHVSYYMGSLATEAMIAVKGLATFKNFVKDLKSSRFDAAFEKNYGLSTADFYTKVSKYVLAMYERESLAIKLGDNL